MRFSLSIYPSRNACLISYTTPSEASEGTFNDTARFSALFSLHHCLIFEESSSSEKSSNSPTITLSFKNGLHIPATEHSYRPHLPVHPHMLSEKHNRTGNQTFIHQFLGISFRKLPSDLIIRFYQLLLGGSNSSHLRITVCNNTDNNRKHFLFLFRIQFDERVFQLLPGLVRHGFIINKLLL